MRPFLTCAALVAVTALTACSPPSGEDAATSATDQSVTTDTPAPTLPDLSGRAGKWMAVEGMFLEISPAADGTFALTMQTDLDTQGTYVGKPAEGGITFERGGEQLLLKAASGDETGLKYLAGKKDCLMVAPGEGYCRD